LSLPRALSAQIALETPSITVLTKCDLVPNAEGLEKYLNYFEENEEIVEDMKS
jgi:ribosome biogenesis GTPase A